ncbi:MAG: DUF4260 family protein [Thermomicrobiales bacterium]
MSYIRLLRQRARFVWAIVAVFTIPAVFWLAKEQGDGWIALLFAIMPDVGLLYGMSPALAKGQLHPRAVRLYNALHSVGGPFIALLVAMSGQAPDWVIVAALAWLSHIAVDRAIGYGLRDKAGYIRGRRPAEAL